MKLRLGELRSWITGWRDPIVAMPRLRPLVGLAQGSVIAIWLWRVIDGWIKGDALEAFSASITLVLFILLFSYVAALSRLQKRHLRDVRVMASLGMPPILAEVGVGATPETFMEGRCANCATLAAENNPFVKCTSGHLCHLDCLVREPDKPVRCPLCLRRDG